MDLSIITTLYQSAPYLPEFHRRVCAVAEKLGFSFELIMVNDGSPDDSQAIAMSICNLDERVQLIELSRNYGHHKAIITGLRAAKGSLVFLIDCDLEEAPELLESFHRELQQHDVDVVYGVQRMRKGGWFERLSGYLFYQLFNLLSTHPIPRNLITARLMTREYVKNVVRHRDQEVFLAGLFAMTGFKQRPILVDKLSKGTSQYSLIKKVTLLVNAITSFSNKPLALIFYLGSLILTISAVSGVYLVVKRLFFGRLLAGWASVMVSLWFLGGLIMFSLGIIGIYLSRIFTESKRRPYTVVRSVYRKQTAVAEALTNKMSAQRQ